MTLPRRWLDDDSAASAIRDVLRAGRRMDPPAGAERAVWLALMGQVGAAGAATSAASASAKAVASGPAKMVAGASMKVAAGAGTSGLIKAILIGAFSGVVAVSGYSALEPASPAPAPVPSTTAETAPPLQKTPSDVKGAPASTPAERPSA